MVESRCQIGLLDIFFILRNVKIPQPKDSGIAVSTSTLLKTSIQAMYSFQKITDKKNFLYNAFIWREVENAVKSRK